MASLRGAQYLWNAASIALNAKSLLCAPGPGPYVTLYVTSDTAATFTVEVAADVSVNPGRNGVDSTPDGGLTWFPYTSREGHAVTVAVSANGFIAVDLSPFGPQFVRLKATTLTGTAIVTAIATAFGSN